MSDTIYGWGEAPENLKTRAQLAEIGMRPGGPEVARIVWGRGSRQRFALLYAVDAAVPKKAPTEAQLAALEKARRKRESCPYCGHDLGYVPGKRFRRFDCPECIRRHIRKAHTEAVATAQVALADPLAVILDTETTSLSGYVVEVAVIGMDGTALFEARVNPLAEISPGAQAVHGITAAMVAAAPLFADIEGPLRAVLAGRVVWAYNASFDSGMLDGDVQRVHPYDYSSPATWHNWVNDLTWHDVMILYARWVGEWSGYHRDFCWQKLPGGDHSALGDCRATLALFKQMAADETEGEL